MWTYTYADARLELVKDPSHDLGDENFVRYEQGFDYAAEPVDELWESTYTDRRNYDWVVRFDGTGNTCEVEDPLENARSWEYDGDHNAVSFTDELDHTWENTYGPIGNVLTVTSPLSQTWTLAWQQPEPVNRPNFWRATQFGKSRKVVEK